MIRELKRINPREEDMIKSVTSHINNNMRDMEFSINRLYGVFNRRYSSVKSKEFMLDRLEGTPIHTYIKNREDFMYCASQYLELLSLEYIKPIKCNLAQLEKEESFTYLVNIMFISDCLKNYLRTLCLSYECLVTVENLDVANKCIAVETILETQEDADCLFKVVYK